LIKKYIYTLLLSYQQVLIKATLTFKKNAVWNKTSLVRFPRRLYTETNLAPQTTR